MISDKYKCIFIHVPKNAGTSIESKICEEENTFNILPDHRTIMDLEPFTFKKFLAIYQKDQSFSLLRRSKYFFQNKKIGNYYRPTNKQRYNNYFKFSIVRSPWSRIFSWYRNIMVDNDYLKKYRIRSNCSFHEFVCFHLDSQPALRSQLYWLKNSRGDLAMDFIGRFDNLEADFKKVSDIINLNNGSLPKKRFTGKSNTYVNAYDSKTKDLIYHKYKEEIKLFNFEFDN